MSNRQARRQRRLYVDENGARMITPLGHGVEITGERLNAIARGDALANVEPGRHLWVSMAVFRIADPERWETEQQHMDGENLVHVSAPGCYTCEQAYTRAVATRPCPGEPQWRSPS